MLWGLQVKKLHQDSTECPLPQGNTRIRSLLHRKHSFSDRYLSFQAVCKLSGWRLQLM